MRRPSLPSLLAVLLGLLGPLAHRAAACAGISAGGPVPIAGEEALVVWDPRTRTEHFVRTAAFADAPADFGFLVPTPSRPTLTEVDDVFPALFRVYRTHPLQTLGGTRGGSGGVTVVDRQVVAGMDAAVLRASDEGALAGWLERHGFASSESLGDWLDPYVRRGWYVTAFRIRPEAAGARIETRAVRMSFRTPRPFYPYSEPAVEGQDPRPLRVSVAAPYRVDARLGRRAWRAPAFAGRGEASYGRSATDLRDVLGRVVDDEVAQRMRWLTVFDEPASERGRRDVFFRRAEEQRSVESTIDRPMRLSGAGRIHLRPDLFALASVDVRGDLAEVMVRRVVRRHRREIRFCYEQDLNRGRASRGELTIRFVVAATGDVTSAAVLTSDVGSRHLESCLTRTIRRWRFPPPDEGVAIVTATFRFGPPPEPSD